MQGITAEYVRLLNRAKLIRCFYDFGQSTQPVPEFKTLCAFLCRPKNMRFSDFKMRKVETPGRVAKKLALIIKEAKTMAAVKGKKIRIRLKGYDHDLVDKASEKIVDTAKRTGAQVSGPVPLPTEKEIVTILRAVHKYKDSREQFEQRTHKRLIDILRPSNKTVEALTSLELPAGVDIEIKL